MSISKKSISGKDIQNPCPICRGDLVAVELRGFYDGWAFAFCQSCHEIYIRDCFNDNEYLKERAKLVLDEIEKGDGNE